MGNGDDDHDDFENCEVCHGCCWLVLMLLSSFLLSSSLYSSCGQRHTCELNTVAKPEEDAFFSCNRFREVDDVGRDE